VDRGLARSGGVDQAAELAERLGLHVAFTPALLGDPDTEWSIVHGPDPGGSGYGVALLSRHPLNDVARIGVPGGGSGRRRSTPRPAGNPGWDREPRVAMRATVDVAGHTVAVTTTHLSYLPWRGVRQLTHLTRVLGPAQPAVLMGDFNLPPWVTGVVARGWRGPGGGPTHPATAPRLQLDQILVRGLLVDVVSVAEPSTSDHRAVVADLRVP
jgi:endonuclease/exonuclease/phosphatase family metal-dependent hydrolase